jgi:hypothetical protein
LEKKDMNHGLWNAAGARVIAASFVLAGLTACGERLSDTHAKAAPSTPASSSAVLVGTAPAQPSGDPPGTTPVDSQQTANTAAGHTTSEISKTEETEQKPQEGDNHAYSSLAEKNPQKAGGVDPEATRGTSK